MHYTSLNYGRPVRRHEVSGIPAKRKYLRIGLRRQNIDPKPIILGVEYSDVEWSIMRPEQCATGFDGPGLS